MLTQDQLKEVLHYCPETGVFTWLVSGHGRRAGAKAGRANLNTKTGKAYRMVKVHRREYLEHRLAFLYMTGEFPEYQVDHEDGNGCRNVWSNLRAVTHAENMKNIRIPANNKSGTAGVSWHKNKKAWVAYITSEGKTKHLGIFHNKEDAIAARKAAEVLYGFHANHGTERPL